MLFCKEIPVAPRRISQVYIHLLCLLFSVSHVSKRRQKVHIEYDLVGYMPVDELLKAEQA